ncbi:MAG: hypothetical protein GY842_22525, partial [bacterium]|nr:hypothetical protein [bacterium]
AISAERLARIASNLPEYVWDREKRYRSMGLGEEVVATLSLSRRADLFLRVVDELKCAPAFAAIVLCERLKAFRRRGLDPERVSDDEVFEIFKAHATERLTRAGVLEVLGRLLAKLAEPGADHPTLDGLLAEYAPITDDELATGVSQTVRQLDRSCFDSADRLRRHTMGLLMRDWRGRVDGAEVARELERSLAGGGDNASVP